MAGLKSALLAGGLLRAVLISWSFYQDATSAVKYTDIDYVVFTDAARCLVSPALTSCSQAAGPLALHSIGDPYARATYRYTPLLALLLTPNILAHPAFGKVVFSACDLLIAVLLHRLIAHREGGAANRSATKIISIVWLLNPIIANISTRGSAESVLGVLVVAALAAAEGGKWDQAAVWFGLAVHFKVYPVIYGASIYVALSKREQGWGKLLSGRHVRFGVVSGGVFVALNAIMYAAWGEPFVEHTYLYHIHRLDHRHNFSPYFYTFYLSSFPSALDTLSSTAHPLASYLSASTLSTLSWLLRHPLSAFVPQMGLSALLGALLTAASRPTDLSLAWLAQTFVFVTFNKVCTSQYFLWYLWLLPPVIPRLRLTRTKAGALLGVWVAGQGLWLSQAARLELKGESVYREVWAAAVVFLLANCWVAGEVLQAYEPKGTVAAGAGSSAAEREKVE